MNTQPETSIPATPATICQLVKLLAGNARTTAQKNNSFIVNEVPEEYSIVTDENILATVLSKLLYAMVNHSENSCIRITAKEYDDIIFVNLKSNRGFDNNVIDNDLQQAQAFAKKMNGNVGLSRDDQKVTGIVFSFPNLDFKKNQLPARTETVSNLY